MMRSPLARVYRPDPTPDESLGRTAHVMGLRRKLLPAGWALIDLTRVEDPEKRREYAEVARAQIGVSR